MVNKNFVLKRGESIKNILKRGESTGTVGIGPNFKKGRVRYRRGVGCFVLTISDIRFRSLSGVMHILADDVVAFR